MNIKSLHIIINPAAGKMEPTLHIINAAMQESGLQWDLFITKKSGDALQFAKESVRKKVDMIAVYGGDGTIMEVMSGMLESDIPLAILPGGTANILATELDIPHNLKEACELITKNAKALKSIDIGQLNKRYFVLRTGLGFEADMVKGANRETKNKVGILAYIFSAMGAVQKLIEARYELKIDGKQYTEKGVTCIVANAGNVGIKDLSLDKSISVSDGLLDVIVVRKANVNLLGHILKTILKHQRPQNPDLVKHWQGKDISVSSYPRQTIQCDGEVLEKTPLHATIIPEAMKILVPGLAVP